MVTIGHYNKWSNLTDKQANKQNLSLLLSYAISLLQLIHGLTSLSLPPILLSFPLSSFLSLSLSLALAIFLCLRSYYRFLYEPECIQLYWDPCKQQTIFYGSLPTDTEHLPKPFMVFTLSHCTDRQMDGWINVYSKWYWIEHSNSILTHFSLYRKIYKLGFLPFFAYSNVIFHYYSKRCVLMELQGRPI